MNVVGALSLFTAMRHANVKNLIFSSSATVYGMPTYLPLDESHPVSALNPYGRTKLHIEEILNDIVDADHKWRIISLRYFNPIGAHETLKIGESRLGAPTT